MGEITGRDGFVALRIKRIVRETSDAVSLVLDVPEHCSSRFRYQAGQFLTVRVTVDGQELKRCYSMSSAPLEEELRITVKRDPAAWCPTGSTTVQPRAQRFMPPRPKGGSCCGTTPTSETMR